MRNTYRFEVFQLLGRKIYLLVLLLVLGIVEVGAIFPIAVLMYVKRELGHLSVNFGLWYILEDPFVLYGQIDAPSGYSTPGNTCSSSR